MSKKFKERAENLKTDIPAVFIALKKKETPIIAKIFAGITVCYALSPIDLIPDFIPVIGLLDDIILLPLFIALTIKFLPTEILDQSRKEAADLKLKNKWYYAIPFALIWILIIVLIAKLIFS